MVNAKLNLRPILKEAALDSCSLLLEQEGYAARCLDFEMLAEGSCYRLVFHLREVGRIGEAVCLADDREEARSGPLSCLGARHLRVVAQPQEGRTWRSLAHAGQIDFSLRPTSVFEPLPDNGPTK